VAFATLPDPGRPLRAVQVGAGSMGRTWLAAIDANPDVELVGLVDLDATAARAALAAVLQDHGPVAVGTSLHEVAVATSADVVVDVTVPAAHLPVTLEALRLGLAVLGEKPLAVTTAQAQELVAAAEVTGRLFMVSQSRRYDRNLSALHAAVRELGRPGLVTTEFFRAPRFGGFRETMAHPLLLDMAVHPFDTARLLTGADPVAVFCEEVDPPWSWYAGAAAAAAVVELTGGARYAYTGSWCSPGAETSWNGRWRLSTARGTAVWDGDGPPSWILADQQEERVPAEGGPAGGPPGADATGALPAEGVAGALADFVAALRTGRTPMGEVHDNLMSLVMVEAAVASAECGRRVRVDDVLERSHAAALEEARDGDLRAQLASWTSLRPALPATS
jgi:predicted dehydrogenase